MTLETLLSIPAFLILLTGIIIGVGLTLGFTGRRR